MRRILAAAVAFALVSVLARDAYRSGSEPASLLGTRMLVAAFVLTAVSACLPRPSLDRRQLVLALVAGAAFGAAGLGEFEALARASAPTVVILVFIAPLWIALAAWTLHGRRPQTPHVVAVLGLLGGLALVVAPPGGGAPDGTAVAFALAASAMSALFFMALERLGRAAQATATLAAWSAAVVVIPLDPGGVADELGDPARAWHGVVIGVLTAAALVLLAAGLEARSAFTASALICVEPVLAAGLAWLVLGELLRRPQVVGGAVVLLAVAALSGLSVRAPPEPGASRRTRRRGRGSRPPPRPARSARRPR